MRQHKCQRGHVKVGEGHVKVRRGQVKVGRGHVKVGGGHLQLLQLFAFFLQDFLLLSLRDAGRSPRRRCSVTGQRFDGTGDPDGPEMS